MDITIENPVGSERSGTDKTGRKWSQVMANDYGYIKGSVGYDKDHVDVFIAKGYQGGAGKVHIVNQVNSDGTFDEHKIVIVYLRIL
jgi:inorganic pyrophosphatase